MPVFLKSLTLKGFKSFADRTTLEFEPGVAVVVGPNGSGKSNLVDAVAWVLGAQGARNLRGAKMEDVIFAGTPKRPSLGRAEVSLTIDNTAGVLPIEFSEVTVTRTLFRSGESEYQINGAPCRLLDVQDLLSDSGVGRQQHVIVGQGQLDTVLNARPEDRRAIVEEAAGVLKYRKRKEKAERRLEATEGNVLRLQDLIREVRRQLKPLERQADAARRYDGVVGEREAIRRYLAGQELGSLRTRDGAVIEQRRGLGLREQAVLERLRTLDASVISAQSELSASSVDDDSEALVSVESLRQRARGLVTLLVEKSRGAERALAASREWDKRSEAERVRRAEMVDVTRAATGPLQLAAEEATAERVEVEQRVAEAQEVVRLADVEMRQWQVRKEALALALAEVRAATGIERLAGVEGVLGPLVDVIEIESGVEAAVAAALGEAMQAIVVAGEAAGRDALAKLREGDAGGALIAAGSQPFPVFHSPAPEGCRYLGEFVRGRNIGLEASLHRLLEGVVLVEGPWWEALDLALMHPELVVVTRDGERFQSGRLWKTARGGAGATGAALDEATQRLQVSEQRRGELDRELGIATGALATARALEAERTQALLAHSARLDAAVEALQQVVQEAETAAGRLELEVSVPSGAFSPAELEASKGWFDALAGEAREKAALVEQLYDRVRAQRQQQWEVTRGASETLERTRTERATTDRELQVLREQTSRLDIQSAELRVRLEAAVEEIRREFDCEPDAVLDAPAPEIPTGSVAAERLRELDRELRLMGAVNPLAIEELDALTERHTFLEAQLEDVRSTRRELAKVIRSVDEEIVKVFHEAYVDVERHFADLFATLFPGGSGKLRLTDADDALNAGIAIDARPSGKSPRRLSLLSGGERSLVAMAFLFAVFRSRPSPFYLLDEVEAALDDVNLHRFLDLVHEFRSEAQLVIVSHQKRTMDAADRLYGVSMPPGGSSMVVTQSMRREDLTVTDEVILTDSSSL